MARTADPQGSSGGLAALVDLPGMDPERLARLQAAWGVTAAADLEEACRTNALRGPEGFGPEVQDGWLSALARGRGWGRPRLLDAARRTASRLLGSLQREETALRLAATGSLRRMAPVASEVSLLASSHDAEALLRAFVELPRVQAVVGRAPTRARVRLEEGLAATLEVTSERAWAVRLLRTTGSEAHVVALEERARARGLRLGEDALWRDDGREVEVADESGLYEAMQLPWFPPEWREGGGLVPPPEDLLAMRAVRGVGPLATDRGRGAFPLEAMAERARAEGYAWALVANRLPAPPSDLAAQRAAVRAWNDAQRGAPGQARGGEETEPDPTPPSPRPLRLFFGVEIDVRRDGSLDVAEGALEPLDVGIAVLRDLPPGEDRTPALRRAALDPRVHVLARPTGGILLGRPAGRVDLEAVWEACLGAGTAVAVSGLPHRLGPREDWPRDACRHGLLVLPAADAHDLGGVDQALLAVGACRRAGWREGKALTTLGADAFEGWIRTRTVPSQKGRAWAEHGAR